MSVPFLGNSAGMEVAEVAERPLHPEINWVQPTDPEQLVEAAALQSYLIDAEDISDFEVHSYDELRVARQALQMIH